MAIQIGAVGRDKWDLDTPALLLDIAALDRNVERMASTFREHGVAWRPHTKGFKTPALAHRLLAAGAHGVTCAKLGEAEVMAASGIRNILLANQVVGEQKLTRLVNLLPYADVIVAADSDVNVRALARAARAKGVELGVVVEVNLGMNRAGVEPGETVVALARLIHESEGLRFRGVMGWEGHTIAIRDLDEKRRAVESSVAKLTWSADLCREAGLPVEIVSCGGTGTYLYTSGLPGVTEVQAGGGVMGDVKYREEMQVPHDLALTVMTTVISRPTPTRIICDAGKKTMSSDGGTPKPLLEAPVESVKLSAEHAAIVLGQALAEPKVGDRLEFVVGYSDTTVFLHDEMYVCRDGRVEVVWPILGRGKLR